MLTSLPLFPPFSPIERIQRQLLKSKTIYTRRRLHLSCFLFLRYKLDNFAVDFISSYTSLFYIHLPLLNRFTKRCLFLVSFCFDSLSFSLAFLLLVLWTSTSILTLTGFQVLSFLHIFQNPSFFVNNAPPCLRRSGAASEWERVAGRGCAIPLIHSPHPRCAVSVRGGVWHVRSLRQASQQR